MPTDIAVRSRRPERPRLLLLGGTAEARLLAERCAQTSAFETIVSLAGRTANPAPLPASLARGRRVGAFGGTTGQVAFLREAAVAAVVDATHPFAERISAHAATACGELGLPLLRLERSAWAPQPGDCWLSVPDEAAAAARLPGLGRRVFLSSGRSGLHHYAPLWEHWFLVRLIEAPREPLPLPGPAHHWLLGRGPFTTEREAALLEHYAIEVLVAKNSGGDATYAKIAAARQRGIPVVLVERPAASPAPRVTSVGEAWAWLAERLGAPARATDGLIDPPAAVATDERGPGRRAGSPGSLGRRAPARRGPERSA